jgi:hypothetical protein
MALASSRSKSGRPSVFGRLAGIGQRLLVLLTAVATSLIWMIITTTTPASATHFRAAQLTWAKDSPNTARFQLTMSFRRDFNAWAYFRADGGGTAIAPNPGDVLQDGNTQFYFGDVPATPITPYLRVTTVNAATNTLTTEAVQSSAPGAAHGIPHAYANQGSTYLARVTSCCRLSAASGHWNNPDVGLGVTTTVLLSQVDASPVSGLPPIIDCPTVGACNFFVPATFPAGTTPSYRFATTAEATGSQGGGFVQPTGATINPTSGLYQVNASSLGRFAPPRDTYYSTQVIVGARNATGVEVANVAVDFFLRITGQANNPPAWITPTPADNTTYSVAPGQTLTVPVAASDPDAGQQVTLSTLNAPAGTFTSTPGNPATGTLTYTPPAPESRIINFTATDINGVSAPPRSIRIIAARQDPSIVWATPSGIVWPTPLGASQLNAAFSSAPGALVPPHAGTFTYTPAAGTVLDPGDRTLSMLWPGTAARSLNRFTW